MSKKVILSFAAIVVAAGAIIFLIAMGTEGFDADEDLRPVAETGAEVTVSNARIVLPPEAGQPAAIYFDIENLGPNSVQVVGVDVGNSVRARMADIDGPAAREARNVAVGPGETLTLGPDAELLVLSEYGSEVIPGATIPVVLTFGNSDTIAFSAPVMVDEELAAMDDR
ncbi:MAG: copper chaperone PCu(A)C [Erythrobacter sp.]|nr:MAG: copper chaperone PCu(A)C [Erythrobacter sp.]